MESFSKAGDGTILPSRDIDMHVARPGSARFFTLLLFTISWVLTHVAIGHVILARRMSGMKPLLKHLVSSGAILISIPQLRNSMPDAPGLDGEFSFLGIVVKNIHLIKPINKKVSSSVSEIFFVPVSSVLTLCEILHFLQILLVISLRWLFRA